MALDDSSCYVCIEPAKFFSILALSLSLDEDGVFSEVYRSENAALGKLRFAET